MYLRFPVPQPQALYCKGPRDARDPCLELEVSVPRMQQSFQDVRPILCRNLPLNADVFLDRLLTLKECRFLHGLRQKAYLEPQRCDRPPHLAVYLIPYECLVLSTLKNHTRQAFLENAVLGRGPGAQILVLQFLNGCHGRKS